MAKVGRRWFDGKDEQYIVSKLKEVWAIGGTDEEAVFYADISRASLNRYMDVHLEMKELRDKLKEKPILKARQSIVNGLGDPEFALKFMERKRKAEFAQRTELTGSEGEPIQIDALVKTTLERIYGDKPEGN